MRENNEEGESLRIYSKHICKCNNEFLLYIHYIIIKMFYRRVLMIPTQQFFLKQVCTPSYIKSA
jgi:hypothetical protein